MPRTTTAPAPTRKGKVGPKESAARQAREQATPAAAETTTPKRSRKAATTIVVPDADQVGTPAAETAAPTETAAAEITETTASDVLEGPTATTPEAQAEMVVVVTTAPPEYDYGWTEAIENLPYRVHREGPVQGRQYRSVRIPADFAQGQIDRYHSGMFHTLSADEFAKVADTTPGVIDPILEDTAVPNSDIEMRPLVLADGKRHKIVSVQGVYGRAACGVTNRILPAHSEVGSGISDCACLTETGDAAQTGAPAEGTAADADAAQAGTVVPTSDGGNVPPTETPQGPPVDELDRNGKQQDGAPQGNQPEAEAPRTVEEWIALVKRDGRGAGHPYLAPEKGKRCLACNSSLKQGTHIDAPVATPVPPTATVSVPPVAPARGRKSGTAATPPAQTPPQAAATPPASDPRADALALLDGLLSGDVTPSEDVIAQIKAQVEAAPAPRGSRRTTTPRTPRARPEGALPTAPDRTRADGTRIPKLMRASAEGPFLIGIQIVKGKYKSVLRDVRTDEDQLFDKMDQAKLALQDSLANLPDAERATLHEQASARLGQDGTAR